MKKLRIWIPLILVLAIFTGYLLYQQRFAKVGENSYDRTVESIDLSGSPVSELSQLRRFRELKRIDLRNTGISCGEYDQVRAWFPDAEILWDIPFQGEYYDMNTDRLTLTTLTREEIPVLDYFTRLKIISAEKSPDYETLDYLRQQRPDLRLDYKVPLGDTRYRHNIKQLTVSGEMLEDLFTAMPYFPELTAVKLEGSLPEMDRILAFREAFPQMEVTWSFNLGGVTVEESAEQLDLTGIPMTVEQIEAALPYMPNVTFIDMTDCGISNEDMDALNRRHEDVKIVWTVDIGRRFRLRTDATYFMPVKVGIYATDEITYNLRYCTDMIAIDMGHMGVSNIDFVKFMPHLKYLLLCETHVTDLTPLTGLKELVYLELFLTPQKDLSPLLTLKALEDLNLSYTYGDAEVIAQMTWLKNLWWCNRDGYGISWKQQQMLREALPDCNFNFRYMSSTGGGWRELPNYYAQRDVLGMYYMTG